MRGDRLGGRVGLLGRDAALLDRERGDVAGGVDVDDVADAPVPVDGDEPVERLREAVEARAVQTRQRDDAIDLDPAVGQQAQLAVGEGGGVGGRDELDAGVLDQLADGVAAVGRRASAARTRG